MTAAYQINAYQPNAYQTSGGAFIPAFDGCAFQFDAFQAAPCPIPPTPIYDGHDGGKKQRKHLKKLRELEDARIQALRDQAEHRKMLIRHAIDPEAKAEYEAKLAREKAVSTKNTQKAVKDDAKRLAKVESNIEKIAKEVARLEIQGIIAAEMAKIHEVRMMHEAEIRRQIRQADDEMALMMMM